MAIRLSFSTTYKWPVKIQIPSGTGVGQHESFTFEAIFRRLKQSRINEIVEAGQKKARGDELLPGEDMDDMELIREILAGWDDPDVPYSDEALAELCDLPTVASQIAETWMQSLQKAKAKN